MKGGRERGGEGKVDWSSERKVAEGKEEGREVERVSRVSKES